MYTQEKEKTLCTAMCLNWSFNSKLDWTI